MTDAEGTDDRPARVVINRRPSTKPDVVHRQREQDSQRAACDWRVRGPIKTDDEVGTGEKGIVWCNHQSCFGEDMGVGYRD
jgi:hypothetical protein